ncbi:helix-turn-helix domain-containing protein [Desulfuromonas acetoxidans]|uniref:Response regulator receiver protein n=4 Tax=Desulfuromonas acetoxidans TaxID=891 RepID=Q1K1J7_DESA6|nr:helix-turn-helix domain-containing protein [Desulfuromonas acetoxidans]EAT16391.1 response regulator receiver protein [Desulfuromonas acetoxidans DSM 684]
MMLDPAPLLTPTFLPREIRHPNHDLITDQPVDSDTLVSTDSSGMGITLPPNGITLDEVEKMLIQQALLRYDGNQTKAANCLGMSRDTIRYRMKKFGLN